MERIEFIGAPYVGKSTLIKSLASQIHKNEIWKLEEEFRTKARKEMGYLSFSFRRLLLFFLSFFGIEFRVYKIPQLEKLNTQILNDYHYSMQCCFNEDFLQNNSIEISNKIYLKLLELISRYSFYKSVDDKAILISEEGILHWHLVFLELLKGNYNFPQRIFKDKGLFPKGVIFCYTDEKTIRKRIGFRKRDKKINATDLVLKADGIAEKALQKQEVYSKYIRYAKENGTAVLSLNTADELSLNIQKINEFLYKLLLTNSKKPK